MTYHSVRIKVAAIVGIVLSLVFSLLLNFYTLMLGGLNISAKKSDELVKYHLSSLKNHVESELPLQQFSQLREQLSQLSLLEEILYVAIIDDQGKIILANRVAWKGRQASDSVSGYMGNQLIDQKDNKSLRTIHDDENDWIDGYQTFLMPAGKEQIRSNRTGFIFIRYDLSYSKERVFDLLKYNLPFLVLLIAAFTSLVFVFLHRYITKPIEGLVDHARHLSVGDYEHSIDIRGKGELIDLANAFTELRHSVSYNIDALKRSGEELEYRVMERTKALQKSEEKSRTIFETANDAAIVIDSNGLMKKFNRSAEVMFGYRSDEVLGLNISILMPEPHHSQHDKYLQSYLEGGRKSVLGTQREMQAVRKNGEIFAIELSANEIHIDGDHEFVGFIRDITQRKEAERESKARQVELAEARHEAQKANAAKSLFLANMSHEIRTPMSAVIGMTELALRTALDDKQFNYISKANFAAKNLLGIINDILDISKIEAGKLEIEQTLFELSDVFSQVTELIQHKADEHLINFQVISAKELPDALIGDPLRLRQVIINLCNNAVKFSNQGSAVTLKAELKDRSDDQLVLLFSVADQGIGIPADRVDSLFDSFTQVDSSTSRQYGGTGLGLSISQQLVHLMGGEIWVESEPGVGSTFYFTVSLKTDQCADNRHSLAEVKNELVKASIAKLNGCRVLLVDDNEINQEMERDLLEDIGVIVVSAYNGEEAVDVLLHEEFDLVLMDCQMPVMDGYRATRLIRTSGQYDNLPIIAMTADVMPDDIERAGNCGMDDHIAKPVDIDQMFITMAKWLHKSR